MVGDGFGQRIKEKYILWLVFFTFRYGTYVQSYEECPGGTETLATPYKNSWLAFAPLTLFTWTVTFQIVLVFRVHPGHYDDGRIRSTCCHDSHSRGTLELGAYSLWENKGVTMSLGNTSRNLKREILLI